MKEDRVEELSQWHALAPEQIETRSFAIIDALLVDRDQSRPEWPIIRRIVHTTGDPAIAGQIRVHPQAVKAGIRAVRDGCLILTDVKMVAAGINRALADRFGCRVESAIDDPAVIALAKKQSTTRSEAAMRHLADRLPGAIVAIGNAPTALVALLDYLDAGRAGPALIIGTPVGFVGAAESKARLLGRGECGVPFVTVEGTRGGSTIAVAVVNALLRLTAGE